MKFVLAHANDVADMQLSPAARLLLSIDADTLAGQDGLDLGATVDNACELQ